MVAINLYVLLGLLQALLAVAVLLGIWIWRQGRASRSLRRARTQIEHLQARPTAAEYLAAERDAMQPPRAEDDPAAHWQALRAAYLEFELNRAQAESPGDVDLGALGSKLKTLLPESAPPALVTADDQVPVEVDDENIDFTDMLQRQEQLLQALRTQIHGAVTNVADLQRCDEKFSLLDLVGRELESCTLMMEEENSFLRDQIRALLESTDGTVTTDTMDTMDTMDTTEPDNGDTHQ